MGATANCLVCVSKRVPVYFALLPLLCYPGASQCSGSFTRGGCSQPQLLHSPSEQHRREGELAPAGVGRRVARACGEGVRVGTQ